MKLSFPVLFRRPVEFLEIPPLFEMRQRLCIVAHEQQGRAVAPLPLLPTLVLGALPIARFGSAGQRQALLPGVIDGSTMECSGRVLPWKLRRTIAISDSAVRLDYVYINAGEAPLFAYWCAHPLFRYSTEPTSR